MAVYPRNFVGPIQPGDTYEKGTTYPADFMGPIRPGDTYEKAGGGSGSSGSQAKLQAAQAEQKLREEQAKVTAQAKLQAAQAEQKQREQQAQQRQSQSQQALRNIQEQRRDIKMSGGRETTKTSRDVSTGNILEIREIKRGGQKVVDVKDTTTGKTTSTYYAPGKAGGGVSARERVVVSGGDVGREVEVSKGDEWYGPKKPTQEERLYYSMLNSLTPDRTGQIYDPKSGMFLKSTYGLGAGGTAIMTPPSPEESLAIQSASYRGSFENVKVQTMAGIKWYEQNIVVPLSKSSAFKSYEKNIVEPLSSTIVQPAGKGIKSGLQLYEEKVVRPLRETFPSLGQSQIGQIAEAKRIIQSKAPGETVRVGLPGQVRRVSAGDYQDVGLIGFGKKVYLGEVETAFTDIGKKAGVKTPEYVGLGARLVSEFGAYALPGYFVAEIGGEMAEASLGGRFGGPKNVVQFIKERPLEVAIAGTLGIASGVKFFTKSAREARLLKKYGSYLDEPTKKAVSLETTYTTDVLRQNIIKPKAKYSVIEDVVKTKVVPRVKGRVITTEYIPEASQVGKVVEIRSIGKGKTGKLFGGTAEISSQGLYKETIKYSDDLTKIIEIGSEGKGTTSLFKKGKEILKIETEGSLPAQLSFGRPSVSKIKVNKQIGDAGVKVDKVTLERGGKKVLKEEISRMVDGERIQIISDTNLNLKSKLITSEIKSTTRKGKDIFGTVGQEVRQDTGFLDIINVGERKSLVKLKGAKGSVTKETRVGQRIEFGIDKTPDASIYIQKSPGQLSMKAISPQTSRDITQFSGQRTTTIFTKPSEKVIKETAEEFSKRLRDIKMMSRVNTRKAFDDAIRGLTESQKVKAAARQKLIFEKVSDIKAKLTRPQTRVSQSGGQSLAQESQYSYGQLSGPQLSPTTYVEPTQGYLRNMPNIPSQSPPLVLGVSTPVSDASLKFLPLSSASYTSSKQITNSLLEPSVYSIKADSLMRQDMILNQNLLNRQDVLVRQDVLQRQDVLSRQDVKVSQDILQRQDSLVKQEVLVKQDLRMKQEVLQRQESLQKQRTKQVQQKIQRPKYPAQITTPVIPIPSLGSSPKSLIDRAKSGELFSAFATIKGKETFIGKASTQLGAEQILKKKLTGTLLAGGLIKRGESKLKSSELLSFGSGEFRKSRVSEFLVVEKKEKRLRRSGTGKEIQAFRGFGSKKKGKKSLFGF